MGIHGEGAGKGETCSLAHFLYPVSGVRALDLNNLKSGDTSVYGERLLGHYVPDMTRWAFSVFNNEARKRNDRLSLYIVNSWS